MALANLFKHNLRFTLDGELNDVDERVFYSKGRQYGSKRIENIESLGVSDVNELRLKCVKLFIVSIISTLLEEEEYYIDNVIATATIFDVSDSQDDDPYGPDYDIVQYTLNNPKYCIHLFSSNAEEYIYTFPERLLQRPFSIDVNVFYYFIPFEVRQYYYLEWVQAMRASGRIPSEEEDEYTSPDESYRQDRCVICLESNPNILYLDCRHIAVCNSCDRMKRTERLRKYSDICRAEISKRIKI